MPANCNAHRPSLYKLRECNLQPFEACNADVSRACAGGTFMVVLCVCRQGKAVVSFTEEALGGGGRSQGSRTTWTGSGKAFREEEI